MSLQAQITKAAISAMPKLQAYLRLNNDPQIRGNAVAYIYQNMTEAEILARLEFNKANEE